MIIRQALVAIVALARTTTGSSSPKPPGFGQRPAPWITYDVPHDFANPTGLARPTFRYWVPDADVDDAVLSADLARIHDAGYGSVEVICLENYGIQPAVVDPALYGYGGANWTRRFGTILRAAETLNMTVDFALGPTQGASIPILHPDVEGMSTELVYGLANVSAGAAFCGALPPPGETYAAYANTPEFEAPLVNYTNKLVAAVAVRKSAVAATDPRVTALDADTLQDLTTAVAHGQLCWTAPDDGHEYAVLAFYQRRTGYLAAQGAFGNATDPNNPASWFAYVVDHFSQAGTDLWTSFTEQYVLAGENGELLRARGLYAWEDSAEFTATLFWTDDFARYFRQSRGYDIVPVLPVLFGTTGVPPSTLENGYYFFSYDGNGDGDDARIRNDFYQALQELYETHHLDGLSTWASRWDLQGRVQPYATFPNRAPPWDLVSAAAHVDAPETESNYFDGVLDATRAMAGGAVLGHRQIYSAELGAHRNFSYAATWPLVLADCARSYAGGVNRVVVHGYPYTGGRPRVVWPGLTTFEWRYSDMWGPRQPAWRFARVAADWMARTQLVLQTGVPRVDVGVYRHKYISVDIKHYGMGENLFGDAALANAGYSYVAVSPALLTRANAAAAVRREDGSVVLAAAAAADDDDDDDGGPGLAALVVANSTNLTADAVTQLLAYAAEGFAILFVGGVPDASPYYAPGDDDRVRQGVRQLLGYPSVLNLTAEADVVDALQRLGVAPAAQNLAPCPILYVHRWDAAHAVDYYYVFNADPDGRHATEALLRGRGVPYRLDPWTGVVRPLVNYTTTDAAPGRFRVWFDLQANQSTIVAFAPPGFFSDVPVPGVHVVQTDVAYLDAAPDASALVARSTTTPTESGREAHSIVLSDGRNYTWAHTSERAAPTELGPWNLTVQDWQPGPDPWNNYTSVVREHRLTLDTLVPWYHVSGLENTSGVGIYTTTFRWPGRGNASSTGTAVVRNTTASADEANNAAAANANATAHAGALLDLGAVLNTVRVWVNEHDVGAIDVTAAVVDIGAHLVAGANSVRIETASTLRNRLLQVNVSQSWEQAQYAATYGRQPYGLASPVRLVPYCELRIPADFDLVAAA